MSETIQIFGEQFENVTGIKAYKPNGDVVIFHSSGVNLKTLNIVNNTGTGVELAGQTFAFDNVIVDGKLGYSQPLVPGESITIEYIEPVTTPEGTEYPLTWYIGEALVGAGSRYTANSSDEHVIYGDSYIEILPGASDNATVTYIDAVS